MYIVPSKPTFQCTTDSTAINLLQGKYGTLSFGYKSVYEVTSSVLEGVGKAEHISGPL